VKSTVGVKVSTTGCGDVVGVTSNATTSLIEHAVRANINTTLIIIFFITA
jgi:hypothetical protein